MCSQEMEAVLRGPRNADGSDDVLVTSYCWTAEIDTLTLKDLNSPKEILFYC